MFEFLFNCKTRDWPPKKLFLKLKKNDSYVNNISSFYFILILKLVVTQTDKDKRQSFLMIALSLFKSNRCVDSSSAKYEYLRLFYY